MPCLSLPVKRLALLSLVLVSTAWGQTDIREIVRKSIVNYERAWKAQVNWAWTQTDTTASDDKEEVDVSEFVPLYGTPYERLIEKNGHPLTAEEQRVENHKYRKALKERERESPSERAARILKFENGRAFILEVPEAYNFELLGEETLDGRPAWVIGMKPRPGFVPTVAHAAMLEHIEGKLWIDKEDVQWAKAEAHVTETISIGWILARIGPGARFGVEQIRVANGLWMPKTLTIAGTAHVLLVHAKRLDERLAYSDYHEVDSASAEKR